MKRYSRRNWNVLRAGLVLGVGYGGYLIYGAMGGITASALMVFGALVSIAILLASVAKRFFRGIR